MNPLAIITLRKEPMYRSAAFAKGLARLGYHVTLQAGPGGLRPTSRADLLVLWNKKRGVDENRANEWERAGGTVIVAENAYLQKVDKSMYAISTHGHNGSGWFPVGDEDRFTPLGFDLKPMRYSRDGYVLVCGQRSIGSTLMASPPRWGELVAKKTPLSRFRAHPGNFAPRTPLTGDLKGAKICLVWSSAAGVQALVEGVPVLEFAPHWICKGWMTDRGEHRSAALNRMAHGQWTVAEIESGEPFARMQAENWGPRWA